MTIRDRYTAFYHKLSAPPLFHHPRWLDILCGSDKWTALFYTDKKGREQAVLPITRPGKLHRFLLRQPPLTPWLGPLYSTDHNRSPQRQHAWQLKVMASFSQQMPRAALTILHLAPRAGSWLPFYWTGFQQTTRYTYQIDLTAPDARLWSAVARNQRQLIRRGQKELTVQENGPWLDEVYQGLQATLTRNKVPTPLSDRQWDKLTSWLLQEKKGILFSAAKVPGQPQGHVFLVWDDRTAYFLVSTAPGGK